MYTSGVTKHCHRKTDNLLFNSVIINTCKGFVHHVIILQAYIYEQPLKKDTCIPVALQKRVQETSLQKDTQSSVSNSVIVNKGFTV